MNIYSIYIKIWSYRRLNKIFEYFYKPMERNGSMINQKIKLLSLKLFKNY